MQLNYRRGGSTYQIQTYTTDNPNWEDSLKLRKDSTTNYSQLTSDMYHQHVSHVRVRKSDTTYAVMTEQDNTDLWAWGNNFYGQLGTGDTIARSSPIQIGSDTDWIYSEPSWEANFHLNYTLWGCGMRSDGSIWAWGGNSEGQLGQNDRVNRSSPIQIGSGTDWRSIHNGDGCIYATKTNGELWVWGDNQVGQLGKGDAGTGTHVSSPVQIGSLTDWRYVKGTGYGCAVALKTDGTIWAWGVNIVGELGQGDTIARSSPVQIGSDTDWAYITGGGQRSVFALKTDGTLWAWGFNMFGELGIGDLDPRSSPVQVGSDTDWSYVSSGYRITYALKTDGTFWSWGYGPGGGLGHNDEISHSSPVQVGSDTNWKRVEAGNYIGVAIRTDGTLWNWGSNSNRTLAFGDSISRSSPTQVGSYTDWKECGTSRQGYSFTRRGL
jgi:alpha-tubulin suppressor-like RCC1 family protein